jgi:hypothetical protein
MNQVDVTKKYNAFPSDFETLEQKKTDRYGLEYVKAIWGTYTLNYPVNNPQMLQYILNRQFAEGTYPIDGYKSRLGLTGDTSYLNLDYTSVNRIPTIIDNMVGKLTNKAWRFQCNPLDTVSKSKYDKYRSEVEADMFLKKVSDEMEPVTGVPLVAKNKYIPEDNEAKELHFQMDFKLDEAMAMEEALKWVFDNNNFDKESIPQLYRDLFECKKTAIFRTYDENKNIRVSRWDHLKLITPYSVHPDFHDIPYQALMPNYTIGTIAKMNPKFTDEQLYYIAKSCAGSVNNNAPWNPDWYTNYSSYLNTNGPIALRQFQNFNITVVNFFFLSPVKTTKLVKKSEKGRIKVETKKDGYVNDKGIEEISNRKLHRFEGFWIPNTEYIWGYKQTENEDRDVIPGGYSPDTELPCKIIAPNMMGMKNKSFVERMIPLEKQMMLAWLKLQQFLIEAMPPGMAINQNALLDVVQGMGDGKTKPTDWTKLYKQTGNIIFTDRDAAGNPINIPFKELAGGISPAFEQFMRVQDYCINKMNEVIGYNTAVDASSPKADALVGTQQMAQEATYDCLRPMYLACTNLIEGTGKRVGLMIQDCLRLGHEDFKKALADAIGQENVDVLTMGRDFPFSSAAISVEIQPDENETATISNWILEGLAKGTITTSDALRVRQQLKTNTKLAGQLLAYLEKKNAKAKQAEAMQQIQANGQTQQESAMAASQAQAQLDEVLTNNKMKVIQLQGQIDIATKTAEAELQMKLQELKNLGANTVAEINTGGKIDVQHAANEGKIVAQQVASQSNIEKEHIIHKSKVQHGLLAHDSKSAQMEQDHGHKTAQIELTAKMTPKTPAKK